MLVVVSNEKWESKHNIIRNSEETTEKVLEYAEKVKGKGAKKVESTDDDWFRKPLEQRLQDAIVDGKLSMLL